MTRKNPKSEHGEATYHEDTDYVVKYCVSFEVTRGHKPTLK